MAAAPVDRAAVEAVLANFKDPETGRNVVAASQIHAIQVEGDALSLTLALTTHSAPLWEETREALRRLLQEAFPQLASVEVNLSVHERPAVPLGEFGLTIKNVIAVASGKGGVGKSTLAACLALGLQRAGARVGLMDADVYGPSVPHLFGIDERPGMVDERIQPIDRDGMRLLSMGMLIPKKDAVIWRGPMLHGAMTQFLRDTDWGQLDYLIIDMPPGTGDIAITLLQLLPTMSAVVVCTPQDVALIDAVKAIAMFRKMKIPVLGLVENMSGFVCPDCGSRHDIFGSGGALKTAQELEVPVLGEVPINLQVRLYGDQGAVGSVFDDATASVPFKAVCQNLVRQLAANAAADPRLPSLPVLN